MAYDILRRAMILLDEISSRGGGQLVVLPQAVGQIMNGAYQGIPFLAWPQIDFAAINHEWQSMGFYGGPTSPFARGTGFADETTNASIAQLIASNPNSLNALALLKMGVTVDQARSAIRGRLTAANAVQAPVAVESSRKFPWGWFLGTLSLGAVITVGVISFSRHADDSMEELQGVRRAKTKARELAPPHAQVAKKRKTYRPGFVCGQCGFVLKHATTSPTCEKCGALLTPWPEGDA